MPAFETPEPISVTIDMGVGDVQIIAEDRTDTVVEVRPTDDTDESDLKAAEQATVDYADGVLTVRTPKSKKLDFSRKTRSVDVSIVVPSGSVLRAESEVADLRCSGRLGECAYKTSMGHVQLDHTGPLRLRTGGGRVTVARVDGDAEIITGTGRIRIGEVDGAVVARNSNGNTEIRKVTGDIRIRCANGDISVEHAWGPRTEAETANGSIRVGEVTRGTVALKTATGDVEIGLGAGLPAKLDLSTGFGRVLNTLESVAESSEKSIEVKAKTSHGDIAIHRA
ncbi:DUF4097 family beta strand repeat-containing protein [Streptomyces qinzhouensis]|uniref:DUF4097 family beta strand repeat protein n=1 Tax=Streptomyces qinzhouensis TaxID=2599401 RepID=A0A5B8IN76_9ACTN|nr:DUF4097 family beta strand repeat-containing protein [Streptomyces qinzhouensis]QDY80102.1 DUF4097 family beta strand repeat protein [Streptomyces qinzhouensis]